MLGLELESRHLLESQHLWEGSSARLACGAVAEIHLPAGKEGRERTGELGTGRKNGNNTRQNCCWRGGRDGSGNSDIPLEDRNTSQGLF